MKRRPAARGTPPVVLASSYCGRRGRLWLLLELELELLALLLLEFDELLLDALELELLLELLDRLDDEFDELFELVLRELLALVLLEEFELWNANCPAPADALDGSALATGAAWAEPAINALAAIIVTPYFMTQFLWLCCPEVGDAPVERSKPQARLEAVASAADSRACRHLR